MSAGTFAFRQITYWLEAKIYRRNARSPTEIFAKRYLQKWDAPNLLPYNS